LKLTKRRVRHFVPELAGSAKIAWCMEAAKYLGGVERNGDPLISA
jgi:hypothetical protein